MSKRSYQQPFQCPRCHGTGRSPLTQCYNDTVAVIKRLKQPTIREVHDASAPEGSPVEVTYKRIDRLERWGIVTVLKEQRPKRVELV